MVAYRVVTAALALGGMLAVWMDAPLAIGQGPTPTPTPTAATATVGTATTPTAATATVGTATTPTAGTATAGPSETATPSGGTPSPSVGTVSPTVTPGGAPIIESVVPGTGGASGTILVNGTNFLTGATVALDGQPLQTSVASTTSMSAVLPANLVSGTYSITVANPGFPPSAPLLAPLQQVVGGPLYVPVALKFGPGDSSSIFVQNISQTFTTVTVQFYDTNGVSDPSWTRTAPIGAGESALIELATHLALPFGFDGSAVVESPQPITAAVNRLGLSASGPPSPDASQSQLASAGAFSLKAGNAAPQHTVPVAFGGYHGYFTTLSLQNAGTAVGSFTIRLFPTGFSSPVATLTRSIPPKAVARVRLGLEAGAPPDFVGTVVIAAPSGGAVVVASETIQRESGVALSYGGFPSGANVANAPLLFKNYNGWVSGAQVVNTSQSPVVVTAAVLQRDVPVALNLGARPLAPNESLTYYLPAINELPDDFVGSAVFTATGPIALVVQLLNADRGAGMAYTGFTSGTPNVSVPVVFKSSAGWESGIQVQNLGQGDALVRVTYHFRGGAGAVDQGLIAAGSSTTFYQDANPAIPDGTIGSAIVTALGGQPIVAIVNEVNYDHGGDATMAYEGLNF